MQERIKALIAKGLSESEAIEAVKWPGGQLRPFHFAKAFQLYLEGLSCESIAFRHHEYTTAILLNARVLFEWDKHREHHKQALVQEAVNSGDRLQPMALSLVHSMIKSLEAKYRTDMENYFTDPKNSKFPEWDPDHFTQFKEGIKMARDIMGLNDKDLKDKPTHITLTPIVRIKVSNPLEKQEKVVTPIIEVDGKELKRQRMIAAGFIKDDSEVRQTDPPDGPTPR